MSAQPHLISFIVFFAIPTHLFLLVTVYRFLFFVEIINKQLETLGFLLETHIQCGEVSEDLFVQSIYLRMMKSSNGVLRKLKAARRIYNLIYMNGNLANSINGLPVLVYIVLMVIAILLKSFEMFVLSVKLSPIKDFAGAICSILLASAVTITTVVYCQETLDTVSALNYSKSNITR